MILSRNQASSLVLGTLVALACVPAPAAESGRCAAYGADLVDLGNGVCGRVMGHIRIHSAIPDGTRSAAATGWVGGGTSSAALRSYEPSMVPTGAATHLRIHAPLDSYSPFR